MTNTTVSFIAIFSIYLFIVQTAHVSRRDKVESNAVTDAEEFGLDEKGFLEVHQMDDESKPEATSEGTVNYPIVSSEIGFVRALGPGISVQIGTSATLAYSFTFKAVPGNTLVRKDKEFVKRLSKDTVKEYKELRSNYNGGLNVPFLTWVGANLNKNVTQETMEQVSSKRRNYNKLAFQARKILTDEPAVNVRVTGKKTLTGTSFIPRVYYAYIKVAKVVLIDGSIVYVLSASPTDVTFATLDGSIILAEGADKFKIEILDR